MIVDRANALCGAIFIVFGAVFAIQAAGLELGNAFRMGPGYFPLALAILLILLGAIILFRAFQVQGEAVGAIPWRGMAFILPAPVIFGLTVRGLGFLPSIFVTCLFACFASRRMHPVAAVAIAAAVTLFTWVVFLKGLGLPFRPIGPWIGG